MLARLQRERLTAAIAGLVVWALHFVVVYSLFSVGCALEWQAVHLLGLNRLALVLILITLPFLLLLAWLVVGSLLYWRRGRAPAAPERPPAGRARFLAMAAFWLNLLALVATLWVSLPLILTTPC